jgi:hypothetical protein
VPERRIRSELTLSPENRAPLRSRYRGGVWFGGRTATGVVVAHDVEVLLLGADVVEPGETCRAQLRVLHPELIPHPLPSNPVDLLEGSSPIAKLRLVAWEEVD